MFKIFVFDETVYQKVLMKELHKKKRKYEHTMNVILKSLDMK